MRGECFCEEIMRKVFYMRVLMFLFLMRLLG